jgi:hypothetical protein
VKITDDFRKKLDVTMIVAAIQRATDERTTLRLLNSSQEMRARLTAGSNQHAFGVVLTKMDDLDANGYIKRSKEAEEHPYVRKHMARKEAAQERLRSIARGEKFVRKANKKLERQLKKLNERLETATNAMEARAINQDINKVNSQLQSRKYQLASVEKDAKPCQMSIDNAELHLRHWATVTRNAAVAGRMKEDFVRRQRHTTLDGDVHEPEHVSTLAVHATSSQAFWKLRNGNESMLAFPAEKYTGVPEVVQWIYQATAEQRETHLDVIIQRLVHCMDSIDSWSKTCKSDLRIGVNYKGLQDALGQESKHLLAVSTCITISRIVPQANYF